MQGHLFLIGVMGTGKTAVSEALSKQTGIPVMDTDEDIRLQEGMEITEIFAQKGSGNTAAEGSAGQRTTDHFLRRRDAAPPAECCSDAAVRYSFLADGKSGNHL